MAQRSDSYLTTEANIIQNETTAGANTALRVGTMFNDTVDSKINNDRVSDNTGLGNSATLVPSQNAVKTYVDTILVGYLNDRGNYDPTITSGYPTTGGSGSGGIIEKGDIFFISANGNIISGDAVPITTPVFTGYTVRALQNTPGQLYANWAISNVGIGYIPENSANKSTDNTMGGGTPSNVLFSTQKAVKEYVDNEIATAVPYAAENVANKIQDLTLDPLNSQEYPSSAAVTSYITAYATGWAITGNSGTTAGTNFIGTTDAQDVVIKANNIERLRIDKTSGTVTVTENINANNPTGSSINSSDTAGGFASIFTDGFNGGQLYLQTLPGQSSTIQGANLSANRTHQLPDANGTIPLTVNGVAANTSGNITIPLESYLVYTALLSFSSGIVSIIVLKNTLGTSITWDNPTNGVFRGIPVSGTPFTTDKTWISSGSLSGGGSAYFVTSSVNIGLQQVNYRLYLHDGTQPGTPTVSNYSIEIRVYP